jgi:hypothetical protein
MPFRPGFELDEARLLMAFCAQSYSDDPVPPAGWKMFGPFTSDKDNAFFVGLNVSDTRSPGQLALVFRGTEVTSLDNIVEDLDFISQPDPYAVDTRGMFKMPYVDSGFLKAYQSFAAGDLNPAAKARAIAAEAGIATGDELLAYVTGHSLGGPLATIHLKYLLSRQKMAPATLKSYTFASPKPGNLEYGQDYDMQMTNAGLSWRVANDLDIIPKLLFTLELPGDVNLPKFQHPSGWLKLLEELVDLIETLGFKDPMNYRHVGDSYVLRGKPAPGGAEPDSWGYISYEHSHTTYEALLAAA